MDPLVAVVITHTTRHLRRTLLGVAASARRADLVVVSCDGDTGELEACVRASAEEFAMDVTLVLRAHTGQSRSGQVRNNAVRAAMDAGMGDEARIVFLDGDCCPAVDCFARHEELGSGG
ncbi:MAG: glycosyltransferase, partial [Planctomycetota bacterium]